MCLQVGPFDELKRVIWFLFVMGAGKNLTPLGSRFITLLLIVCWGAF